MLVPTPASRQAATQVHTLGDPTPLLDVKRQLREEGRKGKPKTAEEQNAELGRVESRHHVRREALEQDSRQRPP